METAVFLRDVIGEIEKVGKGFVAKKTCIELGVQKLMLMLDNAPLILSKK